MGWEIYAHKGRVSNRKRPQIKSELKKRFSNKEWFFAENNHKTVIIHDITKSKVEVIFQEGEHSAEEDLEDVKIYGIVLKSIFFGYRNEDSHKKLFEEVFRRIPWKKQGFWLGDGTRIPMRKIKKLRMKK